MTQQVARPRARQCPESVERDSSARHCQRLMVDACQIVEQPGGFGKMSAGTHQGGACTGEMLLQAIKGRVKGSWYATPIGMWAAIIIS